MIAGIIAGGKSAWNPAALNPGLWLDDSSIIRSGSSATWGNSRGSIGGSAGATPSASLPTVAESELNGLPVVRFSGSSCGISLRSNESGAYLRAKPGATLFYAGRSNNNYSSYQIVFQHMNALSNDRFASLAGGPDLIGYLWSAAMNSGGKDCGTVRSGWMLVSIEVAGAGGLLSSHVNGEIERSYSGLPLQTEFPDANAYDNVMAIGCNAWYPPDSYSGDLACMLFFDRMLSTDDRQKLEGWAAWRYGLQANLPSGHPYKDAPP